MSQATPSLDPLPEHVLPHWRRLQEALQEHWPTPCANDPGYTDDAPPAEVLALCGHCPTLDACRAFAEAWQPTAGVWAGEKWPRPRARPRGKSPGREKQERGGSPLFHSSHDSSTPTRGGGRGGC